MSQQLSLFSAPQPAHPPYRLGWLKAPCGMVFWDWNEGAPNLQPFRYWTCWRGIQRAMPSRLEISRTNAKRGSAA